VAQGKATHEGWRVRKNGTRFWGSVVITALHDRADRVIGFSKVTRDLTQRKLNEDALKEKSLLLETYKTWLEDILGMKPLQAATDNKLDQVLSLLIEIRKDARNRKDWATSDQIRNKLAEAGVLLKDEKDGSISYTIE